MKKQVMAGMLALAATALWVSPPSAMPLGTMKGKVDARSDAPVILAQAGNAEMRVQQLEEQLRQLNGRVEEMSFQLLQMQETIRKAQEDNEFRFQDLEGGAKPKKKSSIETVPGDQSQDTANASGDTTPEAGQNDAAQLNLPMDDIGGTDPNTGKPAGDLGSLKLDENGNVLGTQSLDGVDVSNLPPPDTSTSDQTASLKTGVDAQYQSAYEQVLAGDYASAESGFADFINANPQSKKLADANFWLGEAQYSQGKYNDSAKTFLNAYKTYGKSAKAPEMLLKLAMSLAALDSKDTACATLREVSKAYPKASRAIIGKVASEQKRLAC
ncbi:tol-pal system protein YbgF [Rhizobium sp. KVB221]|uniref:Cell division coordinator CpoB n=1 Tax=Rhizobium setariae TaxID=2801340 RepID=A0A936YQN6_9HYPH|nr:tol-pal system protein YbgF [Rhizobium setariae]MBL0372454.1 tol-pal system protein YbgF [Rhizobium setariae]